MSRLSDYLHRNRHLLGFGFLLTFLSSFGQTFVISLYLPSIQKTFDLSDGGFSSIYAGATLSSAFTITWLGSFIDKVRLTRFTVFVMIGLIFFLVFLSFSYFIPMLFIALYGLRLFGQGMMSHTSITSMARFFDDGRGKAISIGALGHSFGEAVLPIIIVSVMYAVGWRGTLLFSTFLVALAIPYSIYLLRKNSNFTQLRKYIPQPFSKDEKKLANPWQIMKSKAFWIIMPSSMAAAAIGTGFLLFKLKLGIAKGWEPAFIAGGFSAYAAGNALSNLLAGFLSDKWNGKVLFPFYLLPGALGILMLIFSNDAWVYIALIGGIGISNGFGGTVKNVALTEMYGTKIIGSVRSLFTTVMVFSTALGPLLFGFLLDNHFSFETVAFVSLIIYAFCTLNALRILGR